MRLAPLLLVSFVLLVLAFGATAHGEDPAPPARPLAADPWAADPWGSAEREVDPQDAQGVAAARRRLEALNPRFWVGGPRLGPLAAALARDLPDEEVTRLLRTTTELAELGRLIGNLESRADLAARLLALDLEPRAWGDLVGDFRDVALEALLHGEPALARRLIADDHVGRPFADDVVNAPHAEALHLVADALVGDVPLSPLARARLATVVPDRHNRYAVRVLGTHRIAALVRVARTDADPAARVLAARLMHASLDPDAVPHLMGAYVAAASWRLERDDWEQLGRLCGAPPGLLAAPERARHAVLEGYLLLSHIRAYDDPAGAEALARECRRLWADTRDDRARAGLLRLFDRFGYAFVDAGLARPWAAPTWRQMLEVWEGLAAGPGPLARLAGSVAWRQRQELLEPARPGGATPFRRPPPDVGTRVGAAYAALTTAPDAAGLREASRLLVGEVGTPAERQALLDVDRWGVDVDFSLPQPGEAAPTRFPLDDGLRAALVVVLTNDVDPHARDYAARRLALAGEAPVLALLARPGLGIDTLWSRGRHPFRDLRFEDLAPEHLAVLLDFVAEPATDAEGAQDVLGGIATALLGPDASEDHTLADRVHRWIAEVGPTLSPDRFEGLVDVLVAVVDMSGEPRLRAALHPGRERLKGTAVGLRLDEVLGPE